MESNLTPILRFKEYENEWNVKTFKELGSVAMCKRIFKEQTTTQGEIPFYKIGTFGKIADSYISRETYEEYKEKYIYPKVGDILLSASGTIGRTVIYDGEDAYFQDSNIIWFNAHKEPLDNSFLYQFYQVVKWSGLEGSTIKRLYNENVLSTKINLPSLYEQKKIGSFFKDLDDTIALHQQELDALKQTKQGFLQKMFPENNKSKPTVHINEDNNWTEYKMKTVFGKIKNAFVGTASPYYVRSGHFYLESNNIKDGKINRKTEIFINDEFYEKQKSNWLKTGDLVMVQSGHVGHTAVVPEELNNTAAHAVIVFSDTQLKVDSDFINYQLQTYSSKKRLHSLTTGNTIKHILASEMKNFLIQLPSYEEQQKISSIFKDLDDLIELKEQELEALEQTKKGFLQKMFV